jgi:hypothetical protein
MPSKAQWARQMTEKESHARHQEYCVQNETNPNQWNSEAKGADWDQKQGVVGMQGSWSSTHHPESHCVTIVSYCKVMHYTWEAAGALLWSETIITVVEQIVTWRQRGHGLRVTAWWLAWLWEWTPWSEEGRVSWWVVLCNEWKHHCEVRIPVKKIWRKQNFLPFDSLPTGDPLPIAMHSTIRLIVDSLWEEAMLLAVTGGRHCRESSE